MFEHIETKQYRFKFDNIHITVDLDNSFSSISKYRQPDLISYIKYHHYHTAHELFFVGEQTITIFADNKAKEYKNCIVNIPPKVNHLSFRQNDYRLLFSFSATENKSSNFLNFIKAMENSNLPMELETDTLLMSYVKELSNVLTSSNPINEEVIISILKLILYKLYILNTHKQNAAKLSTSESYIIKIDNIINSFQDNINLKTVADTLHLSTKQTSRIIIKTYKKSLSELLTEKRLSVACLLLCHTDNTISEIVKHINFPSESYFYSQFKKKYGCTPYKYKKLRNTALD